MLASGRTVWTLQLLQQLTLFSGKRHAITREPDSNQRRRVGQPGRPRPELELYDDTVSHAAPEQVRGVWCLFRAIQAGNRTRRLPKEEDHYKAGVLAGASFYKGAQLGKLVRWKKP